jgi:hypothetical protein
VDGLPRHIEGLLVILLVYSPLLDPSRSRYSGGTKRSF